MVTIETTEDEAYILSILLNPLILSQMSDDSVPKNLKELLPVGFIKTLGGVFLKVVSDGADAGLFWYRPVDGNMEAHTALLPNCRGRDAIKAAKQSVAWIFGNTDTKTITSYAWSDSPAVAWFARAVGLHPVSTSPWPNTRNGQPVDITYFRIGKPLTI